MAYGGGEWQPPIQNKVMPGTYVHMSSKPRPTNVFGDRGFVACGLNLGFGPVGEIITVEPADLQKESLQLFGLEYTDPGLLPLRELLAHAKTAYIYRLNGDGVKAKVVVGTMTATAKYPGTTANNFTVIVSNNIDVPEKFDVTIRIGNLKAYEKQEVATVEDIEDNPYIDFTGTFEVTPGAILEGGTDGEETAQAHTEFLEKLEKKFINMVVYAGADEAVKRLYKSYVLRRNYMEGSYFQATIHDFDAGTELVIDSYTKAIGRENPGDSAYWVGGLQAGAKINESAGNRPYDGELTLDVDHKQRELIDFVKRGKFVFHEVNGEVRTLEDVNTFTDFAKYKNEDFSKNQIIRVLHEKANSYSNIFNQYYLDKEQNTKINRTVLWNDLYTHAQKLAEMGAIEDLVPEDLIIEPGATKQSVTCIDNTKPVMAMNKLYIHFIVA